jgi:hypothetical protein
MRHTETYIYTHICGTTHTSLCPYASMCVCLYVSMPLLCMSVCVHRVPAIVVCGPPHMSLHAQPLGAGKHALKVMPTLLVSKSHGYSHRLHPTRCMTCTCRFSCRCRFRWFLLLLVQGQRMSCGARRCCWTLSCGARRCCWTLLLLHMTLFGA